MLKCVKGFLVVFYACVQRVFFFQLFPSCKVLHCVSRLMAIHEYYPDPNRNLWRKLFKFVASLGLVGLILYGAYFISTVNSGKNKSVTKMVHGERKEVDIELLQKSEQLIASFDKIQYQREVTSEEVKMLEEALALREEYFEAVEVPSLVDVERTHELKKRWHNAVTEPIRMRADALEEQARVLAEQGKYLDAQELVIEARELVRTINNDYALSEHRDAGMFVRLDRRAKELEALPLYRKSVELEEASRKAAKEEAWEQARDYLVESAQLQEEIIQQYSGIEIASMTRLRTLQQEIVSYDSLDVYEKVLDLIKQGEAAQRAGRLQASSDFYEQARERQSELNRDYPSSRFASAERVKELGHRAQTVLSQKDADEISKAVADLDRSVAQRDGLDVQRKARALLGVLDVFRREFPRSRALPEDLVERVGFLSVVGARIEGIVKDAQSILVPMDGNASWITGSPVPQELFRAMTGSNPSRERDPQSAVESVSFRDCEDFCRRLGWLMQKNVRLPTPEESKRYPIAMGEWLQDADGDVGVYEKDRFVKLSPASRSRTVGFRFVVE